MEDFVDFSTLIYVILARELLHFLQGHLCQRCYWVHWGFEPTTFQLGVKRPSLDFPFPPVVPPLDQEKDLGSDDEDDEDEEEEDSDSDSDEDTESCDEDEHFGGGDGPSHD